MRYACLSGLRRWLAIALPPKKSPNNAGACPPSLLKARPWLPIIEGTHHRPYGGLRARMPSERILFVDDDPVSRRSFARAMRQSGFIVDLAKDGDEAWELATHFPYAVIATDLRMPGMDGMMLIDQLRELQPDPVCLLVTGVKQLEWYREAEKSGVDVIQKPWNGDQLAEALRAALREYHTRATHVAPPESERPEVSEEREVLVVGLQGAPKTRVTEALRNHCQVRFVTDLDAAAALLHERPTIACCLLAEALSAGPALRRFSRVNAAVPVIVLGEGNAEDAGVTAIRNGAQDWFSLAGVDSSALPRAIAIASERSRAPRGPLPVCSAQHNPQLLSDRFRQAISRGRRFSHQAALLLVDVDRFGDINASLGYDAGDELLGLVAERLRTSVRESDAVFRLSQDEFALVLEDLGEGDSLDVPAQRVLNSFATPFTWRGNEVVLTASIGGAVFPAHGQQHPELMKRAESALALAKQQGRNRYCTVSEQPSSVIGPQDGAVQLH
jgi:diguanylate cyclase (GGDEF)-like protein